MPKQSNRHLKGGHKGSRSARHKANGKYAKQRLRTEMNRKRRLKKHLSLHPKDISALKALRDKIA